MAATLERDATGKFLPRNDNDMSIGEVLQKNDEAKAAALVEKEKESPPEKVEKRAAPKKPATTELGADAGDFLHTFVEGKKKDDSADVANKKESDAKAKKEADEKAAKEKAAARPKPKPRVEALTTEQIAAAVAEGVARAKPEAKKDTEKKEEPASQFTPSDERKIAVLAQMEKMYPDKYKGAPDKFKSSLTKIAAYAEKWSKDNPSKEFNEDDEEHTEFFDKNNLHEFWDAEDFDDAKTQIKVDKALEEERRSTNKRLGEVDRKFKASSPETLQAIDTDQIGAARQYWKMLGEVFTAVIKEDGTVDEAKAKELREADPIAFDLRLKAATRLDHEVAEIYRLMNGLTEPMDKPPVRSEHPNAEAFARAMQAFRLHSELNNFAAAAETRLSQEAQEDRLDGDGRDFLPADKYYALPKDKREEKFWTFTARDLAVLRASHLAHETHQIVSAEEEKLKKYAAARGLVPKNGASESRKEPAQETEQEPDDDNPKPLSPEGGSETKLSAGKGAGGKGAPGQSNSFFSVNW